MASQGKQFHNIREITYHFSNYEVPLAAFFLISYLPGAIVYCMRKDVPQYKMFLWVGFEGWIQQYLIQDSAQEWENSIHKQRSNSWWFTNECEKLRHQRPIDSHRIPRIRRHNWEHSIFHFIIHWVHFSEDMSGPIYTSVF